MGSTLPLPRYLEGYKPVEWPNLSARRNPSSTVHHSSLSNLDLTSVHIHARVIAALGRIVGIYCGTSDVLLCYVGGHGSGGCKPVRIRWNATVTWSEVVSSVEVHLAQSEQGTLEISSLKDALGLKMPCLASYSPSDPCGLGQIPFSVWLDQDAEALRIRAKASNLHPSFLPLILDQLKSLLEFIPSHGDQPMSSLPNFDSHLLSTCDRERSGISSNPPPKFAMDYLRNRAEASPRSTAFFWYADPQPSPSGLLPTDSMTYIDWHTQSNRLARWLVNRGLQKDEKVAVCMTRDRYFQVAIMGVMRAGLCYVPIDPDLPPERKRYIALDSKAPLVLTSRDLSDLSLFGEATVYLEDSAVQAEISTLSGDDVEFASPDGLSYLLYTSGTTGNPKGCLITQEGLTEAIWSISNIAQLTGEVKDGRYLGIASIAFDVHLVEVFVPLVLGIPLYNLPRSKLLENLPDFVVQLGITHLGLVPSLLEATLSAAYADGDLEDLKLRFICSGGEKITDMILDTWADLPQLCLSNFYGPSEVTIGCCARIMDSTIPKSNIGKTFPNVSGYVVDENLNVVLRGGIGELVVGGPLVGRGYQGKPDLTEKVFLEWPVNGERVYRTGDLVRMMPDSTFEILGRIDTQIKLRGVRIESEGISSIVRATLPASSGFCLDASTILAAHPKIGVDQLVSFVVWDPSVSVSTRKSSLPTISQPPSGLLQSIKRKCDAELASYMRPSHVIPLTFLPLTSNGKADAKALSRIFTELTLDVLAELSVQGSESSPSSVSPPDRLTGSSTSHPRVIDPFSAQWLPEIHQQYRPDDLDYILPAFPAQEGIMARSAADNKLYVQTVILACKQDVSLSSMKSAWERLVMRHPILRSVFFFGSSLVQVVFKPTVHPLPWQEKQLPPIEDSHLSDWFQANEAKNISQSINDNASDQPLFRITAYTSSKVYLVLSIHHALFDGVSLPILLDELEHVCHEVPLDDPTSLYDVLQAISLTDLSKAENFWRTMYQGFSWIPSSFHTSSGWSDQKRQFTSSLTAIRTRAAQAQVTLQAFLARAFAELIATHLYLRDDVTFGVIRSGRLQDIDGLEKAICPMVSVQPLRVDLKGGDVLHTIQRNLLDSIDHEHISLGQIQAWLRPGLPLFDAVFSLSVKMTKTPQLFSIHHSQNPVPDFPLAVEIILDTDSDSLDLRVVWIHGSKLDHTASHILETFEALAMGETTTNTLPSRSSSASTLCDDTPSHPTSTHALSSPSVHLTNRLRSEIAQFMSVPPSLIQSHSSLISLGLDSLKAVGLSRALRRSGIELTVMQIMSKPSLQELIAALSPNDNPSQSSTVTTGDLATLRTVISKFLGVNESILTSDTSLISLGLDSLKSVGLSRAIRRAGPQISSTQLMTSPSLGELATLAGASSPLTKVTKVEQHPEAESVFRNIDPIHLKLSQDDLVRTFPVTSIQAGMLSQTVASRGELYLHPFPFLISSNVDAFTLQDSWKRLVSLHSILRTTFHFSPESAIWFQAVHSYESLDWSTDSFISEADYAAQVANQVASLQLVDEGAFSRPPFRICFYTSATIPSDRRLVLVIHHALYDGVSIERLLQNVSTLYFGQDIPPVTHFTDILPVVLKQETSGTRFWTAKLQGYLKPALPPLVERVSTSSGSYKATKIIQFNPSSLSAFISSASVTVQCLIQAALAKVLSKILRSSDVLFGHVVSGRSIPEGEDAVGPLVTTIPCRVCLSEGMTDRDLLQAIHSWNVAALPYQHLSLRALQKSLGVNTLWDVLFVFQPFTPPEDASEPLWKFDTSVGEEPKAQYPLTIEVYQREDHFVMEGFCRSESMSMNDLAAALNSMGDIISKFTASVDTSSPLPSPATRVASGENEDKLALLTSLLASMSGQPREGISVNTPLAALGIDSITAIALSARARKQGLHILASDISSSLLVGDLVRSVPASVAPRPLKPTARFDIMIPKDEARRLQSDYGWASNEIEQITLASAGIKWLAGAWQRSGGTRFQHVFAYRLPQNIDPVRLRHAWFALVARHPILRSTVACEDDLLDPRLVVFKPGSFDGHWSEERLPSRELYTQTLQKMEELVSNPPGLNFPPTRALFLTSRKSKTFIIHLHHFQYDAWSLRLVMEDLSQLYAGSEPKASTNMNAFLAYSLGSANAPEIQMNYWKSVFPSGFSPTFFPRLVRKPATTKRTIFTLPNALEKASLCEERAKALGVSLQAVFLACWSHLQAQVTASDEATFGLWHSGRKGDLEGIDTLAVPCMNVLPFRIDGISMASGVKTAKTIEQELRRRTAVIESSDLTRIDEWVGGKGKALGNVFVNIVKVSPDVGTENAIFEPIHAPYWVPERVHNEHESELPRFAVTNLIRDDLMVDIASLGRQDSVLMSVDASANLVDATEAKHIIERWAILVKATLGTV